MYLCICQEDMNRRATEFKQATYIIMQSSITIILTLHARARGKLVCDSVVVVSKLYFYSCLHYTHFLSTMILIIV